MLDVSVERRGGICVVAFSGELDISEVARVESELAPIEAEAPSVLVFDLRGLTFIDSSGLRLVLQADLRARREARRLVLVPGPEAVHRIFLIALLDKRLEFVDDPATLEESDGRPS